MDEPDQALVSAPFELSAMPAGRAILHLKTWARAPLSWGGLASNVRGGARLLALGPGEWLMVSDRIEGPALHADIARLARSQGLAAVDISDSMARLELRGVAVRDVLSTACGLDLHPKSFPLGGCTRTRLAQLPILIECNEEMNRYELYVGTSYRPYLEAWLRDAGASFTR